MTRVETGRGVPLHVMVVGISGAGKLISLAVLVARLDYTYVELSRSYWGPD